MERSGRYVACLVLGVAFAAAMSRPGVAPVATLVTKLASMDGLQRWVGVEANGCPAPHRRDTGSNVAKSTG
jgi:hypothetical protein